VAVAQIAARAASVAVSLFYFHQLIACARKAGRSNPIQPRRILAENGTLYVAGGGAKRREAAFLLHVLGNLEPSQSFDLPLRRAGPYRVRAPDYVLHSESLDEGPH